MKTSAETDKIYPAFAKMQAEINKAKKSSTNPHFKSNYADLTAVHEACEAALVANGFFVTQGYGIEPKDHLYTRLVHTLWPVVPIRVSVSLGQAGCSRGRFRYDLLPPILPCVDAEYAVRR